MPQTKHAMVVETRGTPRLLGCEELLVFVGAEQVAVKEADLLVQHPVVPGHVDVTGDGVGQPDHIVADPGAYSRFGGRQPPMLDVALSELASSSPQQVLSGQLRIDQHDCHRVLQLVTEAVGARCLVVADAGQHPACHRLIQQPAVDHHVERAVRGADLHLAEQLSPVRTHLVEESTEVMATVTPEQGTHLGQVYAGTQENGEFDALPRLKPHRPLHRQTRVEARPDPVGQRLGASDRVRQPRRRCRAQEFRPITGP